MTYQALINGGFRSGIVEQSAKNPRAIWIGNDSCDPVGVPDVSAWLVDYSSLGEIFNRATAAKVKPYIGDLLRGGRGNTDAAAVTLAIAGWTLPQRLVGGGHDQGSRKVLVGSGSLNRDINRGQVHAEHITTALVVDALDDVLAHYGWRGATLQSLEFMIYTGKWQSGSVKDFLPCPSCQRTIKATLQPHKAVVGNIYMLGNGVTLD